MRHLLRREDALAPRRRGAGGPGGRAIRRRRRRDGAISARLNRSHRRGWFPMALSQDWHRRSCDPVIREWSFFIPPDKSVTMPKNSEAKRRARSNFSRHAARTGRGRGRASRSCSCRRSRRRSPTTGTSSIRSPSNLPKKPTSPSERPCGRRKPDTNPGCATTAFPHYAGCVSCYLNATSIEPRPGAPPYNIMHRFP
jgi:hypothetical protein